MFDRHRYRRLTPEELNDAYWGWCSLREDWADFASQYAHDRRARRGGRRAMRRCNRQCRRLATIAGQRGIPLGVP